MYLGLEDKGSVFSILKNWPERRVKAICLTDGQHVGRYGDLGVQVRWRGRLHGQLLQRDRQVAAWEASPPQPSPAQPTPAHPTPAQPSPPQPIKRPCQCMISPTLPPA